MTRQSQFLTAIDCEQAHQLFQSQIPMQPLGSEPVSIDKLLGRVLAESVVARFNVPGFDRSNFDGFAIQSRDVVGATETKPAFLKILPQRIPAGIQPDFTLQKGHAVSISTGGMIPRGADAICLIEHAETVMQLDPSDEPESLKLKISRSVHAGSGISFAGTDIAQGETVLRAGQLLTSRETGVLAAIGEVEAVVYARPSVAVISTGNEIVAPGSTIVPGQVFDSNARIISDAVREVGGVPIELGIAVDNLEQLESIVGAAIERADIVLLSGGTSKGEGDLSYQVVSKLDDPGIIAHGVALKPGKPICLAATRGKPVVVLPGFPTSAIFTFHEFVAPVIRAMAGQRNDGSQAKVTATLATRVNSEVGRTEYMLVGLLHNHSASPNDLTSQDGLENQTATTLDNSDGSVEAKPRLPKAYPMGKGSGSVTTFSRADGFITIDRHTEIVEAGAEVEVQPIGQIAEAADLVVMGSHCQKLDRILNELQREGITVKFFAIGSTAGLNAAKHGDCDLAGIHLFDPESGQYNQPFASESVVIERGYDRVQGLVFRKADSRWASWLTLDQADLLNTVTSNRQLLMINRNQGSGTRVLIDRLLSKATNRQPSGYEIQPTNHHAVCAAVVQERADWGIAIEPVATEHGLGFLPLENEQFDFAISRSRLNSRPVQFFLEVLRKLAGE